MSVIQRIQEKQKWVFGSIALALFIFVIQDAIFKNGNSSRSTTIGKVNGDAIEYTDFENEESLLKEMYGKQAPAQEQLTENVWNQQVNRKVNGQEYEKLGLVYTKSEMTEALSSNNPPQNIRQQFTDQSGAYNAEMAVNYLNQFFSNLKKTPNDSRLRVQNYAFITLTREQELGNKYQALISGATYVPKWLAEKTNADNSSIASVSFVDVPYTKIADSTIKVSDDDINDYLKRHRKQYELKEETRQVAYVPFAATPSPDDTANVIRDLNADKQELKTTDDITGYLQTKESTLGYYDSYISKSAIKQGNKDTLFKMQPGEVFGPYLDGGDYVVARLVGVKQWPDSAKVRHILVATHQADQSTGQLERVLDDSAASKRIDSAIAEIKAGKSWDSVALKYSDDGSKTAGGVLIDPRTKSSYFAANAGMVAPFNEFAFDGKKGETKKILSEYGYHYIEILDQKGSEPAYKFAYLGKTIKESQPTDDSVRNAASQFAASANNDIKTFYDNAAKMKKQPAVAQGILENSYNVGTPGYPGYLGSGRTFVKWVYQADIGTVSEPFKFGDKYIVGIVTAIDKPGLPSAQTARPLVEQRIRNEKKADQLIHSQIKGTTLDAIAQAAGVKVQSADSVYFQARGRFNSVIASEPGVTGAAFNKQLQGKVSTPIAGETGVFVVTGKGISGVPSADGGVDGARRNLEYALRREEYQLQQQAQQAQGPLRKAASVKDYRSNFF